MLTPIITSRESVEKLEVSFFFDFQIKKLTETELNQVSLNRFLVPSMSNFLEI